MLNELIAGLDEETDFANTKPKAYLAQLRSTLVAYISMSRATDVSELNDLLNDSVRMNAIAQTKFAEAPRYD